MRMHSSIPGHQRGQQDGEISQSWSDFPLFHLFRFLKILSAFPVLDTDYLDAVYSDAGDEFLFNSPDMGST